MNNCAGCLYGQTTQFIGGSIQFTVRLCRHDTPSMTTNNIQGVGLSWPTVADSDWCGEWEAAPETAPSN